VLVNAEPAGPSCHRINQARQRSKMKATKLINLLTVATTNIIVQAHVNLPGPAVNVNLPGPAVNVDLPGPAVNTSLARRQQWRTSGIRPSGIRFENATLSRERRARAEQLHAAWTTAGHPIATSATIASTTTTTSELHAERR
jgi:hypothetical protein